MTSTSAMYDDLGGARSAYRRFEAGYAEAAERTGEVHCSLQIDEHRIDLRFAGSKLAEQYLRPLAHLVDPNPSGEPELTIRTWDSALSGVKVPFPAETVEGFRKGGFPGGEPDEGILASYGRPSSGLSMLDLEAGTAVYGIPSALTVHTGDLGGPFAAILSWWATRNGYLWVHGGIVGTEQGGVIITGPKGHGKSTTCLACLLAGMLWIGDDYCLVSIRGTGVMGHSLYNAGKLRFENYARLPALKRYVLYPNDPNADKGIVYPFEFARAQVRTSMAIRAIVFPESKGHQKAVLRPMTRPRALAVLAPTSVLQLSATHNGALAGYAEVARRLPAFSLELAADASQNPPAIRSALERATGG